MFYLMADLVDGSGLGEGNTSVSVQPGPWYPGRQVHWP